MNDDKNKDIKDIHDNKEIKEKQENEANKDIKEKIVDKKNELKSEAQDKMHELKEKGSELKSEAQDKMHDFKEAVKDASLRTMKEAKSTFQHVEHMVAEKATDATAAIEEKLKVLQREKIAPLAKEIRQKVGDAVHKLADKIK